MELPDVDEFWSTLGYRGLSVVWGLSAPLVADLSEEQRRQLVGLTAELQREAPDQLAWAEQWLGRLHQRDRLRVLLAQRSAVDD